MYKKIVALSLLSVFILTAGLSCQKNGQPAQPAANAKPITLNYWRVFDGPDDFSEIITKYRALHPNININYRKLRYEEYEAELLNALAEDRGPDIFSIHNTWMKGYQSKLAPLPEAITMVYQFEKGSIKKEIVREARTTKSLTVQGLKDAFIDAVAYDVILDDGKIYGLPLSVDTLAMFYNKDLLNNAGVSQIPKYWDKNFIQTIKKLTRLNQKKEIIQSGAALGGGANIERFSDTLSVLMMQNGAVMMSGKSVRFNTIPEFAQESRYNPGFEALRFYTDFANPLKESYSWNSSLPNSLEMFISGNLAVMFGYSYHLPLIRAGAPKLNFSVAKLPQIDGAPPTNINFANYWVEVVSKKSPNSKEAWDFVQFMTKAEQAESYLNKTKKPTALRSLIDKQKEDPEIGVFADQLLTARSWYRGRNAKAAEDAFREMVEMSINNTGEKILELMNRAASKIQQTIN